MKHFAYTTLLLTGAIAFTACEEEKVVVPEKRSYKGDIEVLNSCGEPGAAAKMRTYLRENGFDVVSFGNDRLGNNKETIIVLRNPEWEGAKALAQTLNIIGAHNFNMYNLHSRPMKELPWNYYFFVELDGDVATEEGQSLLQELGPLCDRLKLVGSFYTR